MPIRTCWQSLNSVGSLLLAQVAEVRQHVTHCAAFPSLHAA